MDLVRDLTKEEARQLTEEVKRDAQKLKDKILRLWQGRAWFALGYRTWHEYYAAEFDNLNFALDREERKEIAGQLHDEGMPKRHIATALGVDPRTVRRDIGDLNTGNISEAYAPQISPTVTEPATESYQPPARENGHNVMSIDSPWSPEEVSLRMAVELGSTVVVSFRGQHENIIEWAKEQDLFVRIDRRSEWGNPFETPADGDRETVIRNYAEHYLPYKPSLQAKLGDLKGKVLVCWCAPLACHGDVLKELVEQ